MNDWRTESPDDQPCYVISIAAKMVGVHAQTLRYYERMGLVSPSRTGGRNRLYSPRDIERLRRIKTLVDDMGVNLAGVEVVFKLLDRIAELEQQMLHMSQELQRLRGRQVLPQANTGQQEDTNYGP